MRSIRLLAVVFLYSITSQAQIKDTATSKSKDTIVPARKVSVERPDSIGKPVSPKDTLYSYYGHLLVDNPAYNPRRSILLPVAEMIGTSAVIWSVDHYVFHYWWSNIGFPSWGENLENHWTWGNDRFGVKFLLHPLTGGLYVNSTLPNGYNFYESFALAIGGSLFWRYFGESDPPEIETMVTTPVGGIFLGEIQYRVSSDILDDRTYGAERTWREIFAAIVDPMRGFNRLIHGETHRHVDDEIYEKEPLNTTLYTGIHYVNPDNQFGTGLPSEMIRLRLDYGSPFEIRDRQPFDFFCVKTDLDFGFGVGRKLLNNIEGYGILAGKNAVAGKLEVLYGAYQNFDYWDSKIFELGTMGFGGGFVSKLPVVKNTSMLYTTLQLAVVPLAGNSTQAGPDVVSQVRDFNYGGGLEGKFETKINITKFIDFSYAAFYYWIHTYVGDPGNNYIAIMQPKASIKLFRNIRLGFEEQMYYDDRFLYNGETFHTVSTEQRFFLQILFQSSKKENDLLY